MPLFRRVAAGVLGLLLGGLVATPGHAQWVEPPGTGWVQLRLTHHQTQRRFDASGRVEPYFNAEAESITQSALLTGALGLWRGLDVWAELPAHRLQFDDVSRRRTNAGLGDPRFFLRMGPGVAGINDLPVALAVRGGVKLPVGSFENDVEIIPLSEGQRDWELLLEVGRSLHPWPVYVMGWVGYRWREANPQTGFKPGDERIVYFAGGGSVGAFRWKLAVDGFFGRPAPLLGRSTRRELLQVIPTVGWQVGPGTLEVGARLPLHGRNLPAGPTVTLGYFWSWDEPIW